MLLSISEQRISVFDFTFILIISEQKEVSVAIKENHLGRAEKSESSGLNAEFTSGENYLVCKRENTSLYTGFHPIINIDVTIFSRKTEDFTAKAIANKTTEVSQSGRRYQKYVMEVGDRVQFSIKKH